MKRYLSLACLTIAVTFMPPPAHAAMMISSSFIFNDVLWNGSYHSESSTWTSFDSHYQVDATLGDSYSRARASYTQGVGGETISFDISQKRSGVLRDFSQSLQIIQFSVDADTTYNLSGYFDATQSGAAGYHYLFSSLQELYTPPLGALTENILLTSWQASLYTVDESFTLGGSRGDFHSSFSGSLTGNLVVGRTYNFLSFFSIEAPRYADNGATSSGSLTLTIGNGGIAAAPEPSSLAIWSIGLLPMTLLRRRWRLGLVEQDRA